MKLFSRTYHVVTHTLCTSPDEKREMRRQKRTVGRRYAKSLVEK